MPPRLPLAGFGRSIVIRTKPSMAARTRIVPMASRRCFADDKKPESLPPATGRNSATMGHVSEEAADLGEIKGETTPDLDQGTPVREILERDGDLDKAPEVIKEKSNDKSAADSTTFQNLLALGQVENIAAGGHGTDEVNIANFDPNWAYQSPQYDLPELPLPSQNNMKHRYDPLVQQVTNLIMRHGKKSVAQRNMAYVLNHLRTAPAPTPSPARPLLPGAPPPTHLPLDPVTYLTLAIDSVAPLIRIRSQKGAAGGGAALQIPVPLGIRQRRRQAVEWILDSVSKKKSRGSGRGQFAQRFAEEIIGIVEGRSAAWDRRLMVHKVGTSARANLNHRGFVKH
ncbi:30S ribosomal protein-like protein S7 [Bisporella sp. PMI_857]|nr:30S ribosomal protein-like protein S7 [Bisporella sp. PMI_857]